MVLQQQMLFFRRNKVKPWFYIEENKDITVSDNIIKTNDGNKYQFQIAGNCKLKERTYNHYYYEFKFTPDMRQEFNNAINVIETYLKCRIVIFCYNRHNANLLIVSKVPIKTPFSAVCSFSGVTVVGSLCKMHIKFEQIDSYQSWPSIMSIYSNNNMNTNNININNNSNVISHTFDTISNIMQHTFSYSNNNNSNNYNTRNNITYHNNSMNTNDLNSYMINSKRFDPITNSNVIGISTHNDKNYVVVNGNTKSHNVKSTKKLDPIEEHDDDDNHNHD